IMFPLISSVDDFIAARDIVEECKQVLKAEQVLHNPEPELGVMIELPSAVEVIDELAAEVDFLSIGSNDLIQYTLAVDRTNAHVSDLYVPHHPAVLRLLKRTVAAAIKHGKPISLCGDLAHQIQMLPFLIGIGITTFSLDSSMIPVIQKAIGALDSGEAKERALAMLGMARISEIQAFLSKQPSE
ncbi:MAG: putative PEP-binding protein, partial [Lentisphaerota bacterium]